MNADGNETGTRIKYEYEGRWQRGYRVKRMNRELELEQGPRYELDENKKGTCMRARPEI